jgi:hypothetical protein
MGNCVLVCNKKLNDANEVQVNENPEKSDTVGGSVIKRKKTKYPKKVVIKDIEKEDDNNKNEKIIKN